MDDKELAKDILIELIRNNFIKSTEENTSNKKIIESSNQEYLKTINNFYTSIFNNIKKNQNNE